MTKKKIDPSSNPWVYGKGKPLTQSMASQLDGYKVPSSKPSYPTTIMNDELAARVASQPQTAQAVLAGDNYLPAVISQESPYIKGPLRADTAKKAAPMADDLARSVGRQGVKMGTRIAAGAAAAMPGIGDILMPEYANAAESNDVKRMREEAYYKQNPVQPDEDLYKLLGVTPAGGMNEMQPSQMMSAGRLPPAPPSGPGVAMEGLPSGVGQPMSSPNSAQNIPSVSPQKVSQVSATGGRFPSSYDGDGSDNEQDVGDQYQDLLNTQLAGYRGKLGDSSIGSYLNLSPLMAMVDSTTGSNLAKHYDGAPQNAQADMGQMAGIGRALADYDLKKKDQDLELQKALLAREAQMEAMRERLWLQNQYRMDQIEAKNNKPELGAKDTYKIKEAVSKNKLADSIRVQSEFNDMLTEYYNALNKVPGNGTIWTGDLRGELDRLHKKVQLYYKEHEAKLGAITGPDKGFMDAVVASPTGIDGLIQSYKGGIKSIQSGVKNLQANNKTKASEYYKELSKIYPPEVVNDVLGDYKSRIDRMGYGASRPKVDSQAGRSPAVAKPDLADRIKAALEKAKANKVQ